MRLQILTSLFCAGLISSCSPVEPIAESPLDSQLDLGSKFSQDLAEHDVIVIGEMHGTKEVPQVIADLSSRLGKRVLFALELKPESAQMTCPPSTIVTSWGSKEADGRSSEAMLAALCKIRDNAKRHGNETLLIDTRSAIQPTFYDDAASRIAEKLNRGSYDNVIVLTGNFHSKNGSDHLAGALTRLGKSVVTATMSSPHGSAWNCREIDGSHSCGANEMSLSFCKGQADTKPGWTGDVPNQFAWDRCLTLPQFTASPPADKTSIKEP